MVSDTVGEIRILLDFRSHRRVVRVLATGKVFQLSRIRTSLFLGQNMCQQRRGSSVFCSNQCRTRRHIWRTGVKWFTRYNIFNLLTPRRTLVFPFTEIYILRRDHQKNFLWASRLWVGRRKEAFLGYVPKNDEKKNLVHKRLIEYGHVKNSVIFWNCHSYIDQMLVWSNEIIHRIFCI